MSDSMHERAALINKINNAKNYWELSVTIHTSVSGHYITGQLSTRDGMILVTAHRWDGKHLDTYPVYASGRFMGSSNPNNYWQFRYDEDGQPLINKQREQARKSPAADQSGG